MNYARGAGLSLRRRRSPRGLNISEAISLRRHRPDYPLLVLISALLVVGAVVVYAIGPGLTNGTDLSENFYSTKQVTSIGLGLVGFLFASFIPMFKWKKIQYGVIIAAIIAAILVRFVGDEINGAHRWIQVAGFSFQVAELSKFAIVLWLAYFLSKKQADLLSQE
ncbi:MAG: FtsW/RodA/SpoVE family cell cycle protein, partial [Candidatus Saccharibacteria bacterium]|nr:FtsW/RodA/SpoVE family cell cycle protein [Candidatus Saccharibacteria bacterium]